LGMNVISHGFNARDLVIRPQAGTVGADATIGLNSGGFDED
jgi:hypothetical protein